MLNLQFRVLLLAGFAAMGSATAIAATADPALVSAVASPARSPNAVARDKARHPVEELTFFGLGPKMNVVELWPGGGYWTDILGAYLKASGHYTIALPAPGNAEEDTSVVRLRTRLAGEKDRLGVIHETTLGAGHFDIAPPGSADLIVTFRNFHNWMEDGYADQALAACFT